MLRSQAAYLSDLTKEDLSVPMLHASWGLAGVFCSSEAPRTQADGGSTATWIPQSPQPGMDHGEVILATSAHTTEVRANKWLHLTGGQSRAVFRSKRQRAGNIWSTAPETPTSWGSWL